MTNPILAKQSNGDKAICTILGKVLLANKIQEIEYAKFREAVKVNVRANICILGYIRDAEQLKNIFENFKAVSIGLSEKGLIKFTPETEMVSLTEAGTEIFFLLNEVFQDAVEKAAEARLKIAKNILLTFNIKYNAIQEAELPREANLIPCMQEQTFVLLSSIKGGLRFIVIFGVGTFQLNDTTSSYYPELELLYNVNDPELFDQKEELQKVKEAPGSAMTPHSVKAVEDTTDECKVESSDCQVQEVTEVTEATDDCQVEDESVSVVEDEDAAEEKADSENA